MAKKHLINYYLQVQEQYFEMLNDAKDFDDAYRSGHLTQEQFEIAQVMLEKYKDNYNRLSYDIMLLNQPNKKDKLKAYKKQNKKVYSYLDSVSQDKSINESADVLKEFKKLISKKEEV